MPDHPASEALCARLDALRGVRVLVVGDVMLDHYLWGAVERISPEAPVPVLRVERESERPGGAANVALNIAALGGVPVLVGAIGDDERGERLTALCRNAGIETRFVADRRPTTAKLRHIAQNQQLLRVDWEACAPLDGRGLAAAVDEVTEESGPETVTVVSDYAKGAVTPALAAALRERPGRVIVDPRPAQRELYRGFYLMTPNHREAAAISGTEETEHPPRRAAARITDGFTENVLITCGGRGMLLRQADGRSFDLAARARQVYDITGAGDTVAAVTALALAAGLELLEAAALANHAAGVVVGKVGTATATPEEVRDHLMQTPEETP